ncbi:MAG: hypothetical protein Q4F65_05735 [Propionibacteriaceae bacterium]|nr:hypothetical protein [Propionibacteriaceae bacterium]
MTAQLLEYTSPSDVLVRRIQAARSASVAPVAPHRPAVVRAEERWKVSEARACDVARPAVAPAPASVPTRLEWTPRGIAVMVLLVAVVIGVMCSTLVGAFLAISNEPLAPASAAAGLAPAAVSAPAVVAGR